MTLFDAHVYHLRVIVAVNKFASDTPAEMEALRAAAAKAGASRSVVSDHFAQGGAGAIELARAVEAVCVAERAKGKSSFRFLCEQCLLASVLQPS